MAYSRITWLPGVLRAAGLTVVEHDGWRERGLDPSQRFEPRAVVWHHDASAPGDSPGVPGYMIGNFSSAGAQLWVDRAGRWHIIASGRAAHAGTVLPGMPDNYSSIGIETDHTTGEPWTFALLDSLRKGTAAILVHLDVSAGSGLHFHKSICSPPGRKVDPAGLELADERERVNALIASSTRGPVVSLAAAQRQARKPGWTIPLSSEERVARRRIRKALAEAKCDNYAAWQTRLGYTGPDADGIPGEVSLTKLGARYGFRVVP